jgi:hypothetical protein
MFYLPNIKDSITVIKINPVPYTQIVKERRLGVFT